MQGIKTAAITLAVLAIGAQQAFADSYTFGSIGDSSLVQFSQAVTYNNVNYTLTGTVNYTVSNISSTGIEFTVVVSNTSNTGTNQGISSTGFQLTSPTISSILLTQQTPSGDTNQFIKASTDVNAPGGFQNVELCAYTSANCSSATNPNTLKEGQHDTFKLAITYLSPATSSTFTMSNSFIRFAGDLGSYTFGGGCTTNCGTLPLPSSLSIIGAGMIAWGLARRRMQA